MARVPCVSCDSSLDLQPHSYNRAGSFAMCAMCRRNPPKEYLCEGTLSRLGRPCKNIRMPNSTTCINHVAERGEGECEICFDLSYTCPECRGEE